MVVLGIIVLTNLLIINLSSLSQMIVIQFECPSILLEYIHLLEVEFNSSQFSLATLISEHVLVTAIMSADKQH